MPKRPLFGTLTRIARTTFNGLSAFRLCWSCAQALLPLPDGKYVFLRDPNKPVVRLFEGLPPQRIPRSRILVRTTQQQPCMQPCAQPSVQDHFLWGDRSGRVRAAGVLRSAALSTLPLFFSKPMLSFCRKRCDWRCH